MRSEIRPEDVVVGLRALTDEIESGYRAAPTLGAGVRWEAGIPVVPLAVHDAVCGWRVATDQEEEAPGVAACAGCGLGYMIDEALIRRWPD